MNDQDAAEVAAVPSFDSVVLPSDGSAESIAALPTARALCERFRARLVVISVAADAESARALRVDVEQALSDEHLDAGVEVFIGEDPAQEIIDRAAALSRAVVCLSTRGRGRIVGSFIGSVARSVVQRSPTPLVVVGPLADRPGRLVGRPRRRPASWPEPLSTGGVLACVDGSTDSEAVLPEAVRWATALDMTLTIATIAQDAAADLSGQRPNRFGPTNPQEYVDELAARWRDDRADTVGTVVHDPVGVASGLRSYLAAQPVGLVALTTHARSGLDRFRLGAISAEIVAASTAPVLVVPLAGPD